MRINFKLRYHTSGKSYRKAKKEYGGIIKTFDHRVSFVKAKQALRDEESIKWRYPRNRRQEFVGMKKRIVPRARYYPKAKVLYEAYPKESILKLSDNELMNSFNHNAIPTNFFWYSKKYQLLRFMQFSYINKRNMEKMNFEYNKGDDENGNHNK